MLDEADRLAFAGWIAGSEYKSSLRGQGLLV